MEVRYKEDRSKIKVEYNDGDGAPRLSKIKERQSLDVSKIEVRLM